MNLPGLEHRLDYFCGQEAGIGNILDMDIICSVDSLGVSLSTSVLKRELLLLLRFLFLDDPGI